MFSRISTLQMPIQNHISVFIASLHKVPLPSQYTYTCAYVTNSPYTYLEIELYSIHICGERKNPSIRTKPLPYQLLRVRGVKRAGLAWPWHDKFKCGAGTVRF